MAMNMVTPLLPSLNRSGPSGMPPSAIMRAMVAALAGRVMPPSEENT